jgi:adenosylcobinamide-GDP ribazoletransferase
MDEHGGLVCRRGRAGGDQLDTPRARHTPGVRGAAVREPMRLTGVAVRFLTRIPLPNAALREGDLRRATGAFPAVGLVVAAVGVAVRVPAGALWGPAVGTVAAVLAMVAATGALHEDGLADAVDGLFGGSHPSARLAIMRDSRVGTYGALTLAGLLGLRVTLLAPLPVGDFARAVACGAVLGRACLVPLGARLPALPGSSSVLVAGRPPPRGTAIAAIIVAVTMIAALGVWAPVPLMAGWVALAGVERVLRRRIGGVNGDTLGAAVCVVDLSVIAAVAALARGGLV